jgi:hypothetical protein
LKIFINFFKKQETNQIKDGIWLIKNFLNKEQCQKIISGIEKSEFKIARQYSEGRHNKESFSEENEIIKLLENKFKQHNLHKNNQSFKIIKFSLPLEFYKYEVGDFIKRHSDAPREIDGKFSKLTLVLYLSDNCKGGETFFEKFNLNIRPTIGSALLFEQNLDHEAKIVIRGTKYVLRTNCFYNYGG